MKIQDITEWSVTDWANRHAEDDAWYDPRHAIGHMARDVKNNINAGFFAGSHICTDVSAVSGGRDMEVGTRQQSPGGLGAGSSLRGRLGAGSSLRGEGTWASPHVPSYRDLCIYGQNPSKTSGNFEENSFLF